MAVTAQEIRQSYPLPVYNYRVEIGGDAIAFSEVSGLTVGHEVATYKESSTGGGGGGARAGRLARGCCTCPRSRPPRRSRSRRASSGARALQRSTSGSPRSSSTWSRRR